MLRNRLYLIFLFLSNVAFAQELVKDINPQSRSQLDLYQECYACGTKAFFVGTETVHGSELWITDGTSDGTKLLKDLTEGAVSTAFYSDFICMNGVVFFQTSRGMWRSDGTEEGTIPLEGVSGFDLTMFQNKILYLAGTTLLTTTGEPYNMQVVADFPHPSGENSGITFVASDNFVFVGVTRLSNSTGGLLAHEVWATDGTNTTLLKTFTSGNLALFTTINDKLIFSARDEDSGTEYWVSDGSAAGTKVLLEANPGPSGSVTPEAVKVNGTVLISPGATFDSNSTWKTDGTTGGTVKIIDDFRTDRGVVFNNRVYLGGMQITEAGGFFPVIKRVDLDWTDETNVVNGTLGPFRFLGAAGDKLLYRPELDQDDVGSEIFSLDGVADEPTLVEDIKPGPEGSYARPGAAVGDDLVFIADDGVHGFELWRSDGTGAGTALLKDIAIGTGDPKIGPLYRYNDKLYFWAVDEVGADDLLIFESDGTNAGTNPVNSTLHNGNFAPTKNQVVTLNPGSSKVQKTDLNTGITSTLTDLPPTGWGWSSPNYSVTVGDDTYSYLQSYQDGDNIGVEVFRANPVTNEFNLIKDINPGANGSDLLGGLHGVALGNKMIFEARTEDDGYEPWVTDGTEEGTFQLKDINPNGNSNASNYTKVGDRVLFFANGPGGAAQLWSTDGTTEGTLFIKEGNFIRGLGVIGNKAVFNHSSNYGALWITDGTYEGTEFLVQLPLPADYIDNFMTVGNKVYFMLNFSELWVTDGTETGTMKVASDLDDFFYVNGYASEDDMLVFWSGEHLWSTLGTPETTVVLGNVIPQNQMVVMNNKVYFTMDNADYGRELFRMDLPQRDGQEISVSGLDNIKSGDTYDIIFTASSGLPVTARSSDESIAVIEGNQLIVYQTGLVTFTFTQNGSGDFKPVSKTMEVTINKGDQEITIEPTGPVNFESTMFAIEASSTSNLPLTYSVADNTIGKITLEGNFATIVERGSVVVTVSQAGNENYNAAEPVSQTICLNPEHPTITLQSNGTTMAIVSSAANNVWTLNDEELDVTGFSMTPTESGIYRAAAVVEGCQGAFSNPLKVVITGLEDEAVVDFYPNPTRKTLYVKASAPTILRIIDMSGREQLNQSISSDHTIDVSSYPDGMYVLMLNNKQFKFVKQH